jgi:predicted XRE-type DNA-binding protein
VANVNDRIRSDVKELLKQRGLTQQQLADMTGIERPNINAMLSGKVGKMPDRWEKLLDALGLEVVIRPKRQP